jgi:subtilisin family serine protease
MLNRVRTVLLAPVSVAAVVAASIAGANDNPSDPPNAQSSSRAATVGGVLVATPAQNHLIPIPGAVPAAIDGEALEAPQLLVEDEFVVRFPVDVAMTVRAFATGSDGMTGFDPLDQIARESGVAGFRPLFPGADPFKDAVRGLPDMSGWFVIAVDPTLGTRDDAMARFAASPFVEHVEPIGIHPLYATPNDPSYASQWHLNQSSDKDIDAPEGWDVENGSPTIIVAVLDSGVRYYHKDLGGSAASASNPSATNGNIWINNAEKTGVTGVDDDGNGYIDDWVGYDFVTAPVWTCWTGEDCSTADNDPRDFNGHGTHCSGIVAAMNNNGYAVASPAGGFGTGVNTTTGDGVKVMCLRIGHSANYGGQEVGFVRMDSAASAFYYAANKGARIASCSWGSSNSGGLAAAVDYFIASGGLVFKAAGNDNTQTADYLCSRTDVYSVVATSQTDAKASFSTYGTWADISAPGVAILSTYHLNTNPTADFVAALDGTSMATPLVASVAAAVWSANPTWTRTQVWDRVRTTADNIDAQNSAFLGKMGSGRVNLHKALTGSSGGGTGLTGKLLLTFTGSPSLPGVGTVPPEDIVQYDLATGQWSVYFDGSDVGLAGYTIDGLARFGSGALLISTEQPGTLAGLGGGPAGTAFDDSDILLFSPTTLGATTAGTWGFYFDGSDVGLDQNAENIDAIALAPDGSLLISTSGSPSVAGLSLVQDEDVMRFAATTLGAATAGTWSWYIDGSDVGLSTNASEDIDGLFVSSTGLVSFSTLGTFSVTGLAGDGRDYFDFTPTSTGATTAGSFASFFIGSVAGIPSTANVNAVEELP